MPGGFFGLSIGAILEGYRSGALDPVEVARRCIGQVEALDGRVAAWACFDPEQLLDQARASAGRIREGAPPRPLEGIPVGVKDIMNTADFPTQMGSPIWKGFTPGNDARAVFSLRQAGAVIPGKTVTAEFAVHTTGRTVNPHDPSRTPGTSSSGSAAAVACGMVPAALGTQTAGSIVRPASFCGVYGCKPSFGLIPRTGMLKTTDSLDTVGFFTLHLADLPRVLDVLRVHGPNYPRSDRALRDPRRQELPRGRPWRVSLVKTHTWDGAHPYARRSLRAWVDRLAGDGDVVVDEPDLPAGMERAHEVHATIYNKTLSYYFREEFRRGELVSPIMKDLIRAGLEIPVDRYQVALRDQERMARSMDRFLGDREILVSLATAGEAPPREEAERPDPALMWTMTHLPVVCAPAFASPRGLPFGVQVVARRYSDLLLLRFLGHLRSLDLIPEAAFPAIPLTESR
ncbi:MAG: amidase [Methanomicrobiales archaeon]|nr:amidase [Methanomicrobiales archaeon]